MKNKIIDLIKNHYKKIIKLLLTVGGIIVLTQCVKFGCDKNGPYFHWTPAANINVEVKK